MGGGGGPKWKRQKRDHGRPGKQVMGDLCALDLHGAVEQNTAWVLAPATVRRLLGEGCFGQEAACSSPAASAVADHVARGGSQAGAAGGGSGEGGSRGGAAPATLAPVPSTQDGAAVVRLCAEEAFFLSHALKCLTLYRVVESGPGGPAHVAPLSPREAWEAFAQARTDFPESYVTFHHFRSKGWVLRSGLQYGADYVLYHRHPMHCHSTYCVRTVLLRAGEALLPAEGAGGWEGGGVRGMTWTDLQAFNRLCNQVSKTVILLYVALPEALEGGEGGAGGRGGGGGGGGDWGGGDVDNLLSKVAVEEVEVRRWVPDRRRG